MIAFDWQVGIRCPLIAKADPNAKGAPFIQGPGKLTKGKEFYCVNCLFMLCAYMARILWIIAALWAAPLWAADVQIIDGDTLILKGVTYRINGIDAPESAQKCISDRGKKWACGDAATNLLYQLTNQAEVSCDKLAVDPYNRIVARCFADGQDVGKIMVAKGMAWAFLKFSDEYEAEQNAAKAARLGVWRGESQAPWDFRARRWNSAAQTAPEGCPIKGNITAKGKIYHTPWSPWYKRTRISLSHGERWFCNEAEAIAAGWRAPYRR